MGLYVLAGITNRGYSVKFTGEMRSPRAVKFTGEGWC
jgi:hypothetical protein